LSGRIILDEPRHEDEAGSRAERRAL